MLVGADSNVNIFIYSTHVQTRNQGKTS